MVISDAYDLIHREYDRMVGFVRSRLRDSGDREAEDVIQDVLASVVEKLNVASPLEDFTAYIYRGLRNRIIDTFRRKRDVVSLDESIGEEITLNDLLAFFSFNPETDLDRNRRRIISIGRWKNFPKMNGTLSLLKSKDIRSQNWRICGMSRSIRSCLESRAAWLSKKRFLKNRRVTNEM